MTRLFVQACGLSTPLGTGARENAAALFAGESGIRACDAFAGRPAGAVTATLEKPPAALADLDCRNNRLMQSSLVQIAPAVEMVKRRFGADRVAVVLGTSTSGISDGEAALATRMTTGAWPADFHYRRQETGNLALFAARWLGLDGPAYTIATACSSSAKVFASARRLIRAGMADAAVVGGADTLCRMTMAGFDSLELLSAAPCNPFSLNRDGITIGEGAAAFLLAPGDGPVEFLGAGESSDAYHATAPEPDGQGAQAAMRQALAEAGVTPADIAYINLHGTASVLNDAMESRAVASVFGMQTPCSSTKGATGHMLGAAGGCEAAFLWLALNPDLNPGILPPQLWDGVRDPALPALNFTGVGSTLPPGERLAMLSTSFGFGGSNAALVFGRGFA